MNQEFLLFPLKHIIWAQEYTKPNGYEFPEQQVYTTSTFRKFETEIDYKGSSIDVSIYDVKKHYDINSRKLRGVRHDIVANGLTEETDEKMEILKSNPEDLNDYDSLLTPDIIHTESRTVVELSTVMGGELSQYQYSFEKKRIKYEYVLQQLQDIRYIIIIVGPTMVLTNMNLGQEMVDELCIRMRMGLEIEAKICEALGQDIFRDEEINLDEIRIEAILEEINYTSSDYVKYFDSEIENISDNDMTRSDNEQVANILQQELSSSFRIENKNREYLEDYLSKFSDNNSKKLDKRVANFPLILTKNTGIQKLEHPIETAGLPNHLAGIWSTALFHFFRNQSEDSIDTITEKTKLESFLDLSSYPHQKKLADLFSYSTNDDHINIGLAMNGINAKTHFNNPEIKEKERLSKLSFNPNTRTTDIEEFITSKLLQSYTSFEEVNSDLIEILRQSKKLTGQPDHDILPESVETFDDLIFSSDFIQFTDNISQCITEVAYSYKHKTGSDGFFIKKVPKLDILLLIKTTGTHVFISYGYARTERSNLQILDTGRVGPHLYSNNYWIFSDFCSYDEPMLEHLVKASPYLSAIFSHILTHVKVDVLTETRESLVKNEEMWQILKSLLLIYLNNKVDSEELLTSQRYLFMKVLENIQPDIYLYTDRLPGVLRSRLSVYLLKRTIKLMDFYHNCSVKSKPVKDIQGRVTIEYLNLKSLLTDNFLSIEQKINEFYFGYVVSKVKGKSDNSVFKILKKILSEEYHFRDKVNEVFFSSKIPQKHKTERSMLKFMLITFDSITKKRYGEHYQETFKRDILRNFAYSSFSTISTVKASARQHSRDLDISDKIQRLAVASEPSIRDKKIALSKIKRTIEEAIKKSNPFEAKQRPKVIEAITKLVKEYIESESRVPSHLFDLVPYCLKRIEQNGGFDSDIFPKDQYGGQREIHVLEIAARVLQYFVELISRTLCSKYQSETLTHPETKTKFVDEHYKQASVKFEDYITVCKSADISKWCQRHHTSKFCSILFKLTDPIFHGFIFRVLKLWTSKRISFPLSLVAIFITNMSTPTGSDEFNRLRMEFNTGTGVFDKRLSNCMTIKSGMMQGILHYTSSLCHVIVQEVMRELTIGIAKKRFGLDILYTIVQGSDDSAGMISLENKGTKSIAIARGLLKWKENISPFLSMFTNECKTSCGTLDLVEYNSEWHIRRKVSNPTFRWVSASLATSIVERFTERYRGYANSLTDCLEGGSSTFECSLIQLSQAWMHYKLLGLDNHTLFHDYSKKLLQTPYPAYGFFPLDFDILAGIPGFDFQLYCLAKSSNLRESLLQYSEEVSETIIDYDGKRDKRISSSLKALQIGFGKITIWKSMLNRIDLGTLQDAIDATEKDPMLVFGRHTTWEEDKISLLLKLFAPGVKSSLSNFQPIIRMMVASAYLLNRPCMSEIQDLQSVQDEISKSSKSKLEDYGISIEQLIDYKLEGRAISEWEEGNLDLTLEERAIIAERLPQSRKTKYHSHMEQFELASKLLQKKITDEKEMEQLELSYLNPGTDKTTRKKNKERLDEIRKSNRKRKMSLYEAIVKIDLSGETEMPELTDLFPLHAEYENLFSFITSYYSQVTPIPADLSRFSKSKIEVFNPVHQDDFPLIDMAKRKWFNHSTVPLSSKQFEIFWEYYKIKYSFLRNTLKETKEHTGRTTIEIKNLLESIGLKSRKVTLTDTNSRTSSLKNTISRIFWPSTKLKDMNIQREFLSSSTLRSTIFSALSFPFTNTKKLTLISDLLRQSELLKLDNVDIPKSCKRLKIIRDWLVDKDKNMLTLQISKEKLGCFGFFSMRQRDHRGLGEWRGIVNGVDTIIRMKDSICSEIVVSKLIDISLLGKSLGRIIREFSLTYPDANLSRSKFILNSIGKIHLSSSVSSGNVIPIEIDPNLKLNIFTRMSDSDWRITIQDQTIRLVMIENDFRGKECQFTILNDSSRVSDWDPSLSCLIHEYPLLTSWHHGRPAKLSELNDAILKFSPKDHDQYRQWMYKKTSSHGFHVNEYDMDELSRSFILRTMGFSQKKKDLSKFISSLKKTSIEPFEFSLEEIEDMMNSMNWAPVSDSAVSPIWNWADAVENEEADEDLQNTMFNSTLVGLGDLDERQLDSLCQEFSIERSNSEELEELEVSLTKGMPVSNQFFQSIIDEIGNYDPRSIDDILASLSSNEDSTLYPGIVGKFFSVISRRPLVDKEEDDDISLFGRQIDLEQDTMRTVGSVAVSEFEKNRTIDDLEESLDQINRILPTASGSFLDSIMEMKIRIRKKITLYKNESTQESLEELDYNSVISPIIDKLSEENLISNIRDSIYDESHIIPLFKMELNKYVVNQFRENSISNDELGTYKLAIRKSEISPWLLDILSQRFKISIKLELNDILIYESIQHGISNFQCQINASHSGDVEIIFL